MNRIPAFARRITVFASGALALAASVAAGGCGPAIPQHNGYPVGVRAPWKHPKNLTLDDNEAEVDDRVSYPDRRRARWYAVDLPSPGTLTARVSLTTFGESKRQVDLAFEIYNTSGKVLARANASSKDAGLQEKTRVLHHLRKGRYLIQVYAQKRLDRAEYTLRLEFKNGAGAGAAAVDFPGGVPFAGPLPAVPPFDDAPTGHHHHHHYHHHRAAKPKPGKTLVGRIAGIVATSRGTRLEIDRGRGAGVAVGWKGVVTTKGGRSIPLGSFHITKVTQRESFGTVKASSDAVMAAKYVRLTPP